MHYPGFAASILLFLSGQQQHQANKRGRPSRSSPAQGQQPQTPHLSYVRVGGGKIQRIFHWISNLQRSESIDITTARLHACPQNSCGSAGCALVQLKVFMKGNVSALFHGNSSSLFMKPFEEFSLYSQECTTRGSQQAYFSFCLDNNSIKPTKGADPPGQAQHRDNSPKHPKNKCCCPERCEPSKLIIALMENS